MTLWGDNIGTWGATTQIWGDMQFVLQQIAPLFITGPDYWTKLDKPQKKRLIKILATIDSREYTKEKYKNENVSVKIKDVEMLIETAKKISVNVQDISG